MDIPNEDISRVDPEFGDGNRYLGISSITKKKKKKEKNRTLKRNEFRPA